MKSLTAELMRIRKVPQGVAKCECLFYCFECCSKRCEITKAPPAAQGPHSEPCGWLEGDQKIVFYMLNKFVVVISILY